MESGLPLLPVGYSVFEDIREKRRLYVDKTMYLPELSKVGKVVFCARPRRFGKSLTVSTLDSFYSGEKQLFEGLAIEKYMDSPIFSPKPVIRLDMSLPSGADSKAKLEAKIVNALQKNGKRHDVSPQGVDAAELFFNLIEDVSERYSQKVVLLIDEYDAPVIRVIQDPGLSKVEDLLLDTRRVMSDFYGKIKSADENLEFVFITGVTKFSRMGVFSTLNNLKDISLKPEFAAFMGYTQEELETNFVPFIRRTANRLGLDDSELLRRIQDYYDGFSFDGETRLYNPFSVLNLFGDMEFNNYWMESGSDSLIREMLRDKGLTVGQFENYPVKKDFVRSPGEIDAIPPEGFLYQAGYLTLRKNGDSSFSLDYPNFEVRSSMSRLFLQNVYKTATVAGEASEELKKHLGAGDAQAIVEDFRRLYFNIGYIDHVAAMRRLRIFRTKTDHEFPEVARLMQKVYESDDFETVSNGIDQAIANNSYDLAIKLLNKILKKCGLDSLIRHKMNESYYRSLLQSFLLGSGIDVSPERHSNLGRSDLVIKYKNKVYVLELKVVEKAKDAEASAEAAMSQIIDKNYAELFDDPIILALALSEEKRNISAGFHARGESCERLEIGGRLEKAWEAVAVMTPANSAKTKGKKEARERKGK